jgi:hypothetical protein
MDSNLDPTQVDFDPMAESRAFKEMMKLFEELSFMERIKRTLRGINMPHDSGEYKFAKLQIQRLAGPAMAIVLPLLIVVVLLSIKTHGQSGTGIVAVEIVEPTVIDDLEHEEAPPPEDFEFEPLDTEYDGPTENFAPETATFNQDVPLSPKPAEVNSVAIIKSPIVMRNIIGSRNPGQRGKLLAKYGGSAGGEETVMRALRWLKSKQLENGSWPGVPTSNTGLALLTFLAHGEVPGSDCPEFGPTVEKGLKFLLNTQNEDGLFKHRDGNNYSHPIAAYALCEAYSMTRNPLLKEAAAKSMVPIIKGQHASGGWDYKMNPATDRDDTSYMGWCAQAIKAATIAGDLEVDGMQEAYYRAIKGFQKNYRRGGGFGYTSPGRGGLSGVGVLCMQLLDAGHYEEVKTTLEYLDSCTFSFPYWEQQPAGFGGSIMYYWYYITQAKFHAGGNRWRSWNAQFQPELIKEQQVIKNAIMDMDGKMRDIGFWDSPSPKESHSGGGGAIQDRKVYEGAEQKIIDGNLGGRVMDTCLSALQLMVYYRNLPTFEKIEIGDMAEPSQALESTDVGIQITW